MSNSLHGDGSSLPFPQTPTASFAGRTLAESNHQWRQDPQRLPADAQASGVMAASTVGQG